MRPLTDNDIESEISYAYLHAVASHVGAGCSLANRSLDGNGIDAVLTAWAPFENGGIIEEVDLKVQLKATKVPPVIQNGHISYFVKGAKRYHDLRSESLATHRILIVMYLPPIISDWLTISENELLLKKCAYWVSLRGAAVSTNGSGETVYIPQTQIFNAENLKGIFSSLSRNETINYKLP